MIKLDWSDFKSFADTHGLSIQFHEWTGSYDMHLVREPFHYTCSVTKSTSDGTDFETNYKSDGNKQIVQPTQNRPSMDEVSLRLEGVHFTAPPNVKTTKFEKVGGLLNKDYFLRGGEIQFVHAQAGDSIEIFITDKDNVLGYGANFRVADYVPKMFSYHHTSGSMAPVIDAVDDDVSDEISQHLYFELIYDNKQAPGGNTVDVIVNFWKYLRS